MTTKVPLEMVTADQTENPTPGASGLVVYKGAGLGFKIDPTILTNALANYYTKAQADARYVLKTSIWVSGSAPGASQGVNGDIWFQV